MKLELGHMNIPDAVWERVKKLLPKSNKARGAGGRPRIDDRTVMTAIFYRCKTGIAWRDLPPASCLRIEINFTQKISGMGGCWNL
ncbi:transposase [Leptospira alexanderi]|uniref:transposase n=1 Tax=Leptospira alexanderi TaxID=100053 RepID=UPI000288498D